MSLHVVCSPDETFTSVSVKVNFTKISFSVLCQPDETFTSVSVKVNVTKISFLCYANLMKPLLVSQ